MNLWYPISDCSSSNHFRCTLLGNFCSIVLTVYAVAISPSFPIAFKSSTPFSNNPTYSTSCRSGFWVEMVAFCRSFMTESTICMLSPYLSVNLSHISSKSSRFLTSSCASFSKHLSFNIYRWRMASRHSTITISWKSALKRAKSRIFPENLGGLIFSS